MTRSMGLKLVRMTGVVQVMMQPQRQMISPRNGRFSAVWFCPIWLSLITGWGSCAGSSMCGRVAPAYTSSEARRHKIRSSRR
jgi:hypothetical protein